MISPFTKPGTAVVCINAEETLDFASDKSFPFADGMNGLCAGAQYTLIRIEPNILAASGYVAVLGEIERRPTMPGFDLGRFRLPITPESLKSLSCYSPPELDKGAPKPARRRVRA